MFKFKLQRFAEGEAAVSEAADVAVDQTATGTADNVPQNAEAEGAQTADERLPYDQIRQMYAEDINKTVRNAVEKRLSREKNAQGTLKKLEPLLTRAARKYKKDIKDLDGIMAAVNADETYYEQLAQEHGTNVEMERQFEQLARENRDFQERIAQQEEINKIREYNEKIAAQINDVKQFFPDFDLETEMEGNKEFAKLAAIPNLTLLDAYRATHFDSELKKAMTMTAQTVEANVVNNIKSGGTVAENGVGNNSPASVKKDITKLSLKEIRDITERARRGEIITFD
jgi:hypothetical protein